MDNGKRKYKTTVIIVDASSGEVLKTMNNMVVVKETVKYTTDNNSCTTIKVITRLVKKNAYRQGKLF